MDEIIPKHVKVDIIPISDSGPTQSREFRSSINKLRMFLRICIVNIFYDHFVNLSNSIDMMFEDVYPFVIVIVPYMLSKG